MRWALRSSSSFPRISARNRSQALRLRIVAALDETPGSLGAWSGAGPVATVPVGIPASDPEGALAGFGCGSALEAEAAGVGSDSAGSVGPGALSQVAGFGPSDPEGALAGFGSG